MNMENNMDIIRKIIRECVSNLVKEDVETIDDWHEMHDDLTREIFNYIATGNKVTFDLMPKEQYLHALREFMQYGKFMRFPEKFIFQWKELILTNIIKLDVLTSIAGHTSQFPFDEFYDVFDYNQKNGAEKSGEFSKWRKKMYNATEDKKYLQDYNWDTAYQFLDKVKHMDKVLPLFSNGQWVLSDYGLAPLWKLGEELLSQKDPNEIIVTINKVLDVAHQRSDLAELFIEGGSKTLSYISAAQ